MSLEPSLCAVGVGAPMRTALLQLAEDFLSAIVFVAVYLASGNLALAVGTAIAVALVQFAWLGWRGRGIDLMQYSSFGLVIVLGGISLVLDDPRFIMLKPTAVHFAIAAVMLRRGWLGRYLPPIATKNVPPHVIVASGYAWAALMIVLGLINALIATQLSIAVWAWWISVGAFGAKIAAGVVQYLTLRVLVRRNSRAAAQGA